MRSTLSRASAIALLLLVLLAGGAEAKRGRGHGGDDHDEVWRSRQSGAILPLATILETLPPEARDRVIEVEFEYEDGVPIYEIEYVDERGRLIEVEIDARSGVVLKREFD